MFYDELYQKAVAENETNLKFWENHLDGLKALNFDVYANKLKVPVLVPIGNKIYFRGEVKHTNEVTVSLGADYFVKCSTTQAEILRQHRIKGAQVNVDHYRREKQYLENQISFTKENVYQNDVKEIVEVYTEEEDKAWREKHRENVKIHKQGTNKEESKSDTISDAELWERLEELELQEELEYEMLDNYNEIVDKRKENTFLVNEKKLLLNSFIEETKHSDEVNLTKEENNNDKSVENHDEKIVNVKETSKKDILQQVLDKQNALENQLHELKYRDKNQIKTEQDLISRLDEMEQLEEIEDELDGLEDILHDETDDESNASSSQLDDITNNPYPKKLKKGITFADEDNSETIEITFTHDSVEPDKRPYSQEEGISKPSDLYEAYPNLFTSKTKSILKKSKYGPIVEQTKEPTRQVKFERSSASPEAEYVPVDRTIVINDVVEHGAVNQHHIEGGARPTSLFKKKRMQNKS